MVVHKTPSILSAHLNRKIESGKKGLALFLTAGYPSLSATPRLVALLEGAGADIIELGMPFSDPLADGTVIQEASAHAIRNGMSIPLLLEIVKQIRRESHVPLVLMGYLNPILRYGKTRFFHDAGEAGVSGVILPEVPLEERKSVAEFTQRNHIDHIQLVAPTSSDERIKMIDAATNGFLYCVSGTGVTGKGTIPDMDYVKRVKAIAANPVLAGFGINNSEDARKVASVCDGVVVGSALVRKLMENQSEKEIGRWVKEMREGIDSTQMTT